ncbi:polysaccharide pyruvyl transferase family protein [Aliiglaciecola sp.]|nr:polysaccharide pyruvyl transferase family protein [Aliiglaciecola sp.]
MLGKPYFTGIAGSVKNPKELGVKDLFSKAGANTGNFIFVSALRTILNRPESIYQHQADVVFDKDKYDFVAISAANWINPDVELDRITAFIESTDLPCLVVGLGAQISLDNELPTLKKSTERFLKVISERSKTISVRGENTQQALAKYGVSNTTVTGCPSLLLYQQRKTQQEVISKTEKPLKLVFQGTRHDINPKVFKADKVSQINMQVYRYAYSNKQHLLLQSELPDLYHVMKRFSNPEIIESGKPFLEKVYEDNIGSISQYLRQYGLVYWDLDTWLNELRSYDFLIGTRIHGCVSALLAGIPTVLLAHDMRTKELAEKLSIKYVDVREIPDFNTEFVEKIVHEPYDWEKFNNTMTHYRSAFKAFFDENNVATTL